jgi:hypothetical protein
VPVQGSEGVLHHVLRHLAIVNEQRRQTYQATVVNTEELGDHRGPIAFEGPGRNR